MRQSLLIIAVLAVALTTHAVSQKKGAEGETEGVTVRGNKATPKAGYRFEREGPNLIIARPTGGSAAKRSGRTSGTIIEISCTCQQGSGGCSTKIEGSTASCESSECTDCAIQTHIRSKSPNI